MTSPEFAWETLLDSDAPSVCSLKAALFTTYDRADDRLVAEHMLPLFLKLSREPDGEGKERQYFLLELDRRLKQLHDQLVVVSSILREEPGDPVEGESTAYNWIWRSIRHLTVGYRGKAVQHAKLWLLHWGATEGAGAEHLEIVVSSANLTRAAVKGQLQGAWRACIELHPQRSETRLNGWGLVPDFLRELGASTGEGERLAPFVELLARGDCPEGVTFVASVPGHHSRTALRRTPWGLAGLGEIIPAGRGKVGVAILCPFVGSWSAGTLHRWCATFESTPDRLELIWIDNDHPWARGGKWLLPKATLKTLIGANASLLRLCHDPDDSEESDLFHEEHHMADERWSHAKVYFLKRGGSCRLLVTSANFSPAAWGRQTDDGELIIENFELGVCVEQAKWPFGDLDAFENEEDVGTVSEIASREAACITWARAVWDGEKVTVDCRCQADRNLTGELSCGGELTPITKWTLGNDGQLRSGQVPWADAKQPPAFVQLTCEQEKVRVAVFDERPSQEWEDTVPPEVDPEMVQNMRDELLFEQYGGAVAVEADDEVPIDSELRPDDENEGGGMAHADSYSVPAFALARRHLGVVDNWAAKVKRLASGATGEFERRILRRDGDLLIEAFRRQADRDEKKGTLAIGAKLAAEELTIRLKHFPEA